MRLIDSCITQLMAQGPSRTCNESKEEDEEDSHLEATERSFQARVRRVARRSRVVAPTFFSAPPFPCCWQSRSVARSRVVAPTFLPTLVPRPRPPPRITPTLSATSCCLHHLTGRDISPRLQLLELGVERDRREAPGTTMAASGRRVVSGRSVVVAIIPRRGGISACRAENSACPFPCCWQILPGPSFSSFSVVVASSEIFPGWGRGVCGICSRRSGMRAIEGRGQRTVRPPSPRRAPRPFALWRRGVGGVRGEDRVPLHGFLAGVRHGLLRCVSPVSSVE